MSSVQKCKSINTLSPFCLSPLALLFVDSTSAKYSTASHTKGTRMMLINEVALGTCKDVYQFDLDLAAPPAGFDSVHGVRSSHDQQSQFKVSHLKTMT